MHSICINLLILAYQQHFAFVRARAYTLVAVRIVGIIKKNFCDRHIALDYHWESRCTGLLKRQS